MKKLFVWLVSASICAAQAVSIGPFATEDWVDERIKESESITNGLASASYVDDVADEIRADFPDVSGLATKEYVDAVSNAIPDVTGLATKAYVDAVSNAIPDVSTFSTVEYVNTTSNNLALLMDDLVSEEELGSSVSNIVPAWALVPIPPVTAEVDPAFTNWLATTNVVIDDNVGAFVSNVVPSWALVPIPPVTVEVDPAFTNWLATTNSATVQYVDGHKWDWSTQVTNAPGFVKKSGDIMTGNLTMYEPQNGATIYFPSDSNGKLSFGSTLFEVDDTTRRVTIRGNDVATVEDLAGFATVADATLTPVYSGTPTYSEWVCEPDTVIHGYAGEVRDLVVRPNSTYTYWSLEGIRTDQGTDFGVKTLPYDPNATNLVFSDPSYLTTNVVATRTRTDIIGYQLGSQSDKPLVSREYVDGHKWDWVTQVTNAPEFVKKSGDTMTGGLTVPNLTVGSRASGSTVGMNSAAEGSGTIASGSCSHAEGTYTTASGDYSHAEGNYTTASSDYSHAEGSESTASGSGSHAEGFSTTASGSYSHAEGSQTTASAASSHAEGANCNAGGSFSHAEGYSTITQNNSEHAQGRFNASHTGSTDAEKTIHSIGIGFVARTNAVEVMLDGKVFVKGVGGYDGTNPTTATNLATYLQNAGGGGGTASDKLYNDNVTLALGTNGVVTVTPNYYMSSDTQMGNVYTKIVPDVPAEELLQYQGDIGTSMTFLRNKTENLADCYGYTRSNIFYITNTVAHAPATDIPPILNKYEVDSIVISGKTVAFCLLDNGEIVATFPITPVKTLATEDYGVISLNNQSGRMHAMLQGTDSTMSMSNTNATGILVATITFSQGNNSFIVYEDGDQLPPPYPTRPDMYDIRVPSNLSEYTNDAGFISSDVIAPGWQQGSYTNGDFVIYNTHLYECTNMTSGAWVPADWKQTSVTEILGNLRRILDEINGEAL